MKTLLPYPLALLAIIAFMGTLTLLGGWVDRSQRYLERGNAYQNAGQPHLAQQSYQYAVDADPQNLSALNALGWLLIQQSAWTTAQTQFDSALALINASPQQYPTEAVAMSYLGRGTTTYQLEGCPAALPFLQQASDAAPDLPTIQQGGSLCEQ